MRLNNLLTSTTLLIFLFAFATPLTSPVCAQEALVQSQPEQSGMPASDSVAILQYMLNDLQHTKSALESEKAELHDRNLQLEAMIEQLKKQQLTLHTYNDSLNQQISGLGHQLHQKSEMLESQLKLQKEKEQLFAEKEQLYKEAINSSMIDKVKLEGQISTKDSRLEGKEREISLLQLNIDEKNRDIENRNSEIHKIVSEKAHTERKADSLRNSLSSAEKNLMLTTEQLKYAEIKLKDCENRYSTVTNKKKKTKVVQGFAIKNYRTPDFALAPKDANNPSVYVISNKNTSNIEFDYVTGASIMLKDLSKPNGSLTYDVGFFLGFGGNNLFKNFYLGPNFKLFDLLHINIGANVAEYEALKEGFNVGDVLQPGISIPTTKEWKINGYIGFTFDLELITMIGKR